MGWKDDEVVTGWKADRVVKGAPASFVDRAGRYVRGLIDEAANLGTGLSDEFGAAVDATVQPVIGSPIYETSSKPTWRERYDENLAGERKRMAEFREENPVAATAANVTGSVVGGMAALPGAATSVAPTLLGNVAKMGTTGAVLGGIQGFGEGEGGFENRATKATMGAAFGGATGAAMPVLGVGGRWALDTAPGRALQERVISPIARVLSGAKPQSVSAAAADGGPPPGSWLTDVAERTQNAAQSSAIQRIATALQRGKLEPSVVNRRLTGLGDEAMLADVDPQLLSVARMANTMPGATRSHAKTVLESRDRRAGDRLISALEGSEPPPSAFALRGEGQAFDQNLRAVGQRAYGAMDDAGLRQTPELMQIYENPHVAAAIDRVMAAEQATRVGTNRAPASPVEIMHKVKQAIWDLGFDKETARPGPMASWYRDLGIEYVNRLKRANPALADADRAYSQAASLPEYFDAGANLLRREGTSESAIQSSAPALADMLMRTDPQQRIAARVGSTIAGRTQAQEGTDSARALAKRLDTSGPVRSRVNQLYDPDHASRILNQAASERQFAETSNEILRGSKTADKLAEVLDTGNTAVRIGSSGVTGRVLEKIDDLVNKLAGPNEAVRDEIGRLTLNPNSAENRRILNRLAEILMQRQQGHGGRAGFAGAVGGSFAGP